MKSESVARLAFGASEFGVGVDEVDLVDGVDLVEVKVGNAGPLAVGGSMRMKMDVWRSLTTGECGDVLEHILLQGAETVIVFDRGERSGSNATR